MIQERTSLDQRICELEEQVIVFKMQSDKYQEDIKLYEQNDMEERNKFNFVNNKECDKLRREKEDLNEELLALQDRYREKSDKMLNL